MQPFHSPTRHACGITVKLDNHDRLADPCRSIPSPHPHAVRNQNFPRRRVCLCVASPAENKLEPAPSGLALIAAMGKEPLSDGDGLKAQVAALTRDYVVEPHIGPPHASPCDPVPATASLLRSCCQTRSIARIPDHSQAVAMARRVPDCGRCERAAGGRGARQGAALSTGSCLLLLTADAPA